MMKACDCCENKNKIQAELKYILVTKSLIVFFFLITQSNSVVLFCGQGFKVKNREIEVSRSRT